MIGYSIELHIDAEHALPESAGEVETTLLSRFTPGMLRVFDGHECRSEIFVIYFTSVRRPLKLLTALAALLKDLDMVREVSALVYQLDVDTAIRVDLANLPERLPIRRSPGRMPVIFDYFAVPLPDGRFGHLQYISMVEPFGDFAIVLDVISSPPSAIEVIADAKVLFGPVRTAVAIAAKKGRWQYIGNRKRERIPTLLFRVCSEAAWTKVPGQYSEWYTRDMISDEIRFVGMLTEEYRRLEFNRVWTLTS